MPSFGDQLKVLFVSLFFFGGAPLFFLDTVGILTWVIRQGRLEFRRIHRLAKGIFYRPG